MKRKELFFNLQVRFRAAERARIHSTDLLCHIHRAREDSGQNEAERLNASMGMYIDIHYVAKSI